MSLLAALGLKQRAAPPLPAAPSDWAEAEAAHPPRVMPTPYGPYAADWLDEPERQFAIVASALALIPAARRAQGELAKAKERLAKAKKLVEAGPHSPEDIAADVVKHATPAACNAAGDAERADNDLDVLRTLLGTATEQLEITQLQWTQAVKAAQAADERAEAVALKDAVEKESAEIDTWVKLVKTTIEIPAKVAKAEWGDLAMQVAELGVDLYKGFNGAARLARAETLEASARGLEIEALAEAIALAARQTAAAVAAIDGLHTCAARAAASTERARTQVAFAYDAGSKGTFKLRSLATALKVADEVRAVALGAAAEAVVARKGGGDIARAAKPGQANAVDNRAMVDRLLREMRGWEEAALATVERCRRQKAHWQSLYGVALKAMAGASGHGQSMDDALTLK